MEAMREIGAFLEGERKRQQLSLEAVSRHTRISVKMLRAIEEGELEVIGTPLLIRGFLKTYCEALGIDPRPILEEYGTEIRQYDDERDRLRRFERWMKSAPSRGKLLVALLVLPVVAAVLAAGWALWWPGHQQKKTASLSGPPAVLTQQDLPGDLESGKPSAKPESPPEAGDSKEKQDEAKDVVEPPLREEAPIAVSVPKIEEGGSGSEVEEQAEEPSLSPPERASPPEESERERTAEVTGSALDSSPAPEGDREILPAAPAPNEAQVALPGPKESVESEVAVETAEPGEKKHTIRIVADEESWVQVRVDQVTSDSGIMKPGEERSYSAEEAVRLWVGNAGGIRVYWDDKPLKPLGQRGEVVRVRLPDPKFLPES